MASSSASSFAFSLLLVAAAAHLCCCRGRADACNGVAAIYSLGDSITDTGNLVKEAPPGSFEIIKHLPYGITFSSGPGSSVPEPLPREEHELRSRGELRRRRSHRDTVNSLKLQLRWFKDFIKSSFATDEGIRKRLQSSIVLVGEIGGNDYNYAFFTNKTIKEVEKLVPGVVQTVVDDVKEVLDMGASRVIVPGNFPIGCIPGYLTMKSSSEPSDYNSMGCPKELNIFTAKHNSRLQRAIARLRPSYPNASIAYADYFRSFFSLLKGAAALGFDASSTHKACCGAGGKYNYDQRRMCGVKGTTTCAEPSTYVSWDGIHMTQAAYKAMSRLIYHGRYLQPKILNFSEKNGQI